MRKGLGPNTTMIGLGDMGSSLPTAFEEAFVGQETAFYSTDWKHICDYVGAASAVLFGLDARRWSKDMRDAIWDRDLLRRDKLLEQARGHRIETLPSASCEMPARDASNLPEQQLDTYAGGPPPEPCPSGSGFWRGLRQRAR